MSGYKDGYTAYCHAKALLPKAGDNVNNAINHVLTRMADEHGITSDQMKDIIEKAIHAGVTSSDPVIRDETITRFGGRELSTEEFIEEIARMIDIAHLDM